MFTTSAHPRAGRLAAKLALSACSALAALSISSATALASGTEVPATSSEVPAGSPEAPAGASEAAAGASEALAGASEAPAGASEAPAASSEAPATASEVPTASSILAAASTTETTVEGVGSARVVAASSTTATCERQTFSQPFAAFGDDNYYTLVAGSTFNSPEEGWKLTGGARIAAGGRPGASAGGTLQLPPGAKAVSPSLCVTLQYPTARLWLDKAGSKGTLHVEVAYARTNGSAVIKTVAKMQAGNTWEPSEPFGVRPELGGHTEGTRLVRFVLIAHGERESSFQTYDLFVDPRML